MYIRPHVKILINMELPWPIFEKYSNTKFHFKKNHSAVAELLQAKRRADRQTDRQTNRQTETTKLIFDFRNFTNAPTNRQYLQPTPLLVRTAFGGGLTKSLMMQWYLLTNVPLQVLSSAWIRFVINIPQYVLIFLNQTCVSQTSELQRQFLIRTTPTS
jgi:hypothetical protein